MCERTDADPFDSSRGDLGYSLKRHSTGGFELHFGGLAIAQSDGPAQRLTTHVIEQDDVGGCIKCIFKLFQRVDLDLNGQLLWRSDRKSVV